ncbi:MAG: DUF3887 domain-containing protein [Oscillospiraceae bacterium]|nr:DUF3887 domain-containing protein [Oscillospiraceae bacterium]
MKKTIKLFSLLMAFVLTFTACGPKEALSKEEAIKLSDGYVQCIANRDYETVVANCRDSVKKQIDAAALQQAWESVAGTAGGFVSATATNFEEKSGYATVSTVAEFENGGFIITLSFDSEGKIRGIWFNFAPEDSVYQPIDTDLLTEETVLIGEYDIKGVVTTPDNMENYPVVVLVQGSGQSDFDETIGANKPFRELAHGLAQKGIASIRINKRLYQKPALAHEQLTIWDEYMDDIYAAIDYAKANISENVFVIGHSQGGMSAPKIALDNDLKGVVMMAGTIRGLEDVILDQNIAVLNAMDISDAEKQRQLKAVQDGVDAVKALTEATAEPVLGVPARYWLSMRDLDGENILKNRLTVPVLILQGEADFQVYMDKDFGYMQSVLGDKENIQFKSYPGLNHLFMPQSLPGVMDVTEYTAENHIPQYVIDDIAAFILE